VGFSRPLIRLARSAWRLPGHHKVLAVEAMMWLAVCWAALRVTNYAAASALITAVSQRSRTIGRSAEDCADALRRASRILRVPGCLVRAMAAQAMLRRSGRAAVLTFGVQRYSDGRMAAHAWTECDGVIVCGGDEAARYASLAGPGPS
jgi:Transglutaminase-like superfamily